MIKNIDNIKQDMYNKVRNVINDYADKMNEGSNGNKFPISEIEKL